MPFFFDKVNILNLSVWDGSLDGFSYLCKATLPQERYGVGVGGAWQVGWGGGTTLSLTIDT